MNITTISIHSHSVSTLDTSLILSVAISHLHNLFRITSANRSRNYVTGVLEKMNGNSRRSSVPCH
ncbi:hypothetical protein Hdeb2414_s0071g00773961 [Helianthus debilis subsp. tardiflorus]